MPQVNMYVDDKLYAILVKEAARRQLESEKVVKISSLAAELLKPVILSLNGDTPPQDANPDETPQTNSKEDEQISNLFANLDI